MRKFLVCIVLCLATICPTTVTARQSEKPKGWTINANAFLGAKFLEKDNWEPVDQPFEGGVLLDFRPRKWWINFAVDFLYAWDQEDVGIMDLGIGKYSVAVESQFIELNLGVRKIWESFKYIRPFIGGGLAIINGRIESRTMGGSAADQDTGFGIWVDTGLYVLLSNRFNIGMEGRWSKAEVDLFDREARVGGWHIGVILGLHF